MTKTTIDTRDGAMRVHTATPAGGKAAAVIVIQEAFGVNSHIRDVVQRFANEGFVAAAPEIFHRAGEGLEFGYEEMDKIRPIFSKITNGELDTDIAATLAWLRARPDVDPAKVAVVGFCLGGFAAFLAACHTDAAAFVSFYGGGIVAERPGISLRPILDEAEKIQKPITFFFGDQDQGIPRAQIDAIADKLTGLKKPFDLTIYEGAGHGFFCDERKSFHDRAAKDAWKKTVAFLRENLDLTR